MCGIVGLINYDAPLERARAIVEAMNAAIHHRGPDGEGLVAAPDATMAMKRLAIVDVVHGHQPMATEDESIVLVYNGEIYNAPQLRRQLEERGVRFRTRSDTEVILRLYELDPDDVERHLVGMWAFAVHDRRRRRVVLSRDRFGIKPLFVADTGTTLAFASELRAFDRTLPGFGRLFEVDHDAAHAMLSWSYVPEAATIYRGVRRLPPATRMTINIASGERRLDTYWTLEPSSDAARVRSLDEACENTEALLRRAVKEHLESDVPVATFLSGGIDSSLVTAYANDIAPGTIKAYSIGFREPKFDESPFARATAEKLGVPFSVEMFDEVTARGRLPDALLAYDEPFGDSSSLATYLVSSHVARDYKVVLGGDGGDEVFGGYKKYLVVHLRRPFASMPRLRDNVGRALGRIPLVHDRTRGWTELLRTVRRVSRGLSGSDPQVYAQLTQIAPLARTAPLVRVAANPYRFEEEIRARFERASGTELQRTLAADLASTLCNDMLVKVDRASMACHLEARVPFLDHRVAEYGVGLPQALTIGELTRKWAGKRVLRALHERRFGHALANRAKMGFGVPVERWLRGPFNPACERLFATERLDRYGILSSAELGDGRFNRWLATDPLVVWHAFALAAWCETSLGDGPNALREMLAS
ncbi:MAG: asparagine synthase (glutamine-hydrolyzing) [Labilithrix sp.]|nr:asparagine synthase (glutamine-hydrolyzing) [Labilithrix sp.]MCW5814718.1 asparagine synthase (glutamine-hydrolyzing) [Labilithrix sp.]